MTEKIQKRLRSLLRIFTLGLVLLFLFAAYFFTTKDTVQQSIWSLFPPLIAIALALVTKEVYSSLFLGILSGALLFSGYNPEQSINHIFKEGIFKVLSDTGNVGILCFLVILGMMVQLMNKTGGSDAFGRWASKRIRPEVHVPLEIGPEHILRREEPPCLLLWFWVVSFLSTITLTA